MERGWLGYLKRGVDSVYLPDFISFDNLDFKRAVLFLWTTLIFDALSSMLSTFVNSFTLGFWRISFTASLIFFLICAFLTVVLRSWRNFFLACNDIGIIDY